MAGLRPTEKRKKMPLTALAPRDVLPDLLKSWGEGVGRSWALSPGGLT